MTWLILFLSLHLCIKNDKLIELSQPSKCLLFQVKAIQYDPVSVRMAEPGTYDRWIVTLTSREECEKVIQQGMTMDGDKVIIRIWDDVLHQEKIFGENIGFNYPCRYRLQKEMHNQVLKNFLATSVNWHSCCLDKYFHSPYANKDADQPAHQFSLISVFVIHFLEFYNTHESYTRIFNSSVFGILLKAGYIPKISGL